jgi:hypothetical protein
MQSLIFTCPSCPCVVAPPLVFWCLCADLRSLCDLPSLSHFTPCRRDPRRCRRSVACTRSKTHPHGGQASFCCRSFSLSLSILSQSVFYGVLFSSLFLRLALEGLVKRCRPRMHGKEAGGSTKSTSTLGTLRARPDSSAGASPSPGQGQTKAKAKQH